MSGRGETVRLAAAGDIHCGKENRSEVATAFDEIRNDADLVLLAGDLTTHGEPEQAAVLGDIVRDHELPVYAVLGNHDWHANRCDEVVDVLRAGGVNVLNRTAAVAEVRGIRVGIAGTKGFVGGFPDSELPDFGEPLLRQIYAETSLEVEGLAAGLDAVADCDLRVALLHYSPTTTTLEGERQTIWAFLGSDRLASPIADKQPHLVVHGHGHSGTFEGFVGAVPVFNVAVPVMGRDFFVFELDAEGRLVRAEADEPRKAPERAET
ncbi:MAG: metallophosphoesterase family protein [Gaiellaceae bacterium]